MPGTMPGACRRGRPCTAWLDNINTWTGLTVEKSIRMTEDREINGESKSTVWSTIESRTAKGQNRPQPCAMCETASTVIAVNSRSRSRTPSLITISRRRRLRLTVITDGRTSPICRRRQQQSPVSCSRLYRLDGGADVAQKIAKRKRNGIEFLQLFDRAMKQSLLLRSVTRRRIK